MTPLDVLAKAWAGDAWDPKMSSLDRVAEASPPLFAALFVGAVATASLRVIPGVMLIAGGGVLIIYGAMTLLNVSGVTTRMKSRDNGRWINHSPIRGVGWQTNRATAIPTTFIGFALIGIGTTFL